MLNQKSFLLAVFLVVLGGMVFLSSSPAYGMGGTPKKEIKVAEAEDSTATDLEEGEDSSTGMEEQSGSEDSNYNWSEEEEEPGDTEQSGQDDQESEY